MGQLTVLVKPAAVQGADKIQARARALFKQAIDSGLAPLPVPEAGLLRVSLYLQSNYLAGLERWAKKLQRSLGYTFAALVEAAYRADVPAQPSVRDSLQAQFYEQLWKGLAAKKIVFAEGGTGLGKSRIIVKVALEHLGDRSDARVGIFVPTIALLRQMTKELARGLKRHQGRALPSIDQCAFVMGKAQFVCDLRLSYVLEDMESAAASDSEKEEADETLETIAKARQWMRNGGRHHGDPILSSLVPDLAWLADDLLEVAPKLPIERCLVGENTSNESAGLQMYKGLRAKAETSPIVLGTQTMLCSDAAHKVLGRGALLADSTMVLIDEAHELEESMGTVVGNDVSFLELRRVIRAGLGDESWKGERLATSAHNAIKLLDDLDQLFGERDEDWASYPEEHPPKWDQYAQKFEALAEQLRKLGKLRSDLIYEARALEWAASGKSVVRVSYSAVIRTPRIVIGPTGYRRFFEQLWSPEIGFGLLSGTLYVPTINGYSANYMRNILFVPETRLYTFPPVDPPWLRSTPTLYLPSKGSAKHFSLAPWEKRKTDPQLLANWVARLMPVMEKITDPAKGGTLVLCCSYEDVEAFGKAFSQTNRLIEQRRGISASAFKEKFLEYYTKGIRPVWFATGAAWTGLDLVPKIEPYRAEEDYLLTDLIIPRLPFRVSGNSAQIARFSGPQGAQMRLTAMLFRLRQGIGRLVRHQGVRHRRLWLLDGRPWGDPDFIKSGLAGKLRFIWDAYPKRGEIQLRLAPKQSVSFAPPL